MMKLTLATKTLIAQRKKLKLHEPAATTDCDSADPTSPERLDYQWAVAHLSHINKLKKRRPKLIYFKLFYMCRSANDDTKQPKPPKAK